jgi:peptide deformylase
VFLNLKRPKIIEASFEDENGLPQKAKLDGYFSRIFQHEYDHMLGRLFTERASRLKLELAGIKAEKELKRIKKRKELNG